MCWKVSSCWNSKSSIQFTSVFSRHTLQLKCSLSWSRPSFENDPGESISSSPAFHLADEGEIIIIVLNDFRFPFFFNIVQQWVLVIHSIMKTKLLSPQEIYQNFSISIPLTREIMLDIRSKYRYLNTIFACLENSAAIKTLKNWSEKEYFRCIWRN